MSRDKRVFQRIKISTNTSIKFKNQCYPVTLKNISLQGATVETESDLKLLKGNSCVLKISPEGSSSIMKLEALTMYQNNNCIGFQFSENHPSTIQELHQLISVNFDKTEA